MNTKTPASRRAGAAVALLLGVAALLAACRSVRVGVGRGGVSVGVGASGRLPEKQAEPASAQSAEAAASAASAAADGASAPGK